MEVGLVVNNDDVISHYILLKSGERNSDSLGVCVLKCNLILQSNSTSLIDIYFS